MATRPFLDLAYRLQRFIWRRFRPRTRGVKVMMFNSAGELLVVRNGYGNTKFWMLPGGGIRPWEEPAAAARREIREVGVETCDLEFVATYRSSSEGKRIPSGCSPLGASTL